MKASGALANPLAMVSRYFNFLLPTSVASSFNAGGHSCMYSLQMKPCIFSRERRMSCGAAMGCTSPL